MDLALSNTDGQSLRPSWLTKLRAACPSERAAPLPSTVFVAQFPQTPGRPPPEPFVAPPRRCEASSSAVMSRSDGPGAPVSAGAGHPRLLENTGAGARRANSGVRPRPRDTGTHRYWKSNQLTPTHCAHTALPRHGCRGRSIPRDRRGHRAVVRVVAPVNRGALPTADWSPDSVRSPSPTGRPTAIAGPELSLLQARRSTL